MSEEKIRNILVDFDDNYNKVTKNLLKKEIESAIKWYEEVNACNCALHIEYIIITSEKIGNEDDIIPNSIFSNFNSGREFDYESRILILEYNSNTRLAGFRNIIAHELSHARFNFEMLNNGIKKNDISLNDKLISDVDPAISMIDEYMACKYSNMYYYDLESLRHFNACQDNFNNYYDERKNKAGALKPLATLICNIIISDNVLKTNNIKTMGIYNKDVREIRKKLEKIDFIPTEEQYNSLVSFLKEKEYCAYN